MDVIYGLHKWMALMDGINGWHSWMAFMDGINGHVINNGCH
jgi:hypothetical protein